MVIAARPHVHTPFSYLGDGWTDCAELWYIVRDQLAWRFTQTKGGMHLYVRMRVRSFPCLGNGWTHCAEIWYLVRAAR